MRFSEEELARLQALAAERGDWTPSSPANRNRKRRQAARKRDRPPDTPEQRAALAALKEAWEE